MVPKIENILFISDLSEDSMSALAWSMMLAHRHDAGITFLYVIENELPRAKIGVRSVSGEELNTALSDSSRPEIDSGVAKRIHRFCGDVMAGMTSNPVVVDKVIIKKGMPADLILKEIGTNNYDLVAMSSDGVKLFKGASINSIARRVYQHGKIPVFVIPVPEKEETDPTPMPSFQQG